jgi:hypothetical protein
LFVSEAERTSSSQQVGGGGLRPSSVRDRLSVVRGFLAYTNEYPWHWAAAHLDE